MKNQGVWVMKLITLLLSVFIIVYMGYHIYAAFYDPLRTVTCVLVRAEDAMPVSGLFVRDEVLLTMPDGVLRYAVADGERVSPGQAVAMRDKDESAPVAAAELQMLEGHLEQLLYIDNRTVSSSDSADSKALVLDCLTDVRDTVDSGRWLRLGQQGKDLRDALFRQEYTLGDERNDLPRLIDETDARISELRLQLQNSMTKVPAPRGGLFVSVPDGLEQTLTPQAIESLLPDVFDTLYAQKATPPADNTGKLIVDSSYRYVFVLPDTDARKLSGAVTLRFHDEKASFTQSMDLERVSESANGRCVVTLSNSRYISRFYNHRKMEADVVFQEYEGLRVPREAVRVDEEGKRYVFCRVLSQVIRKHVEIISDVERENFYLCAYQTDSIKNLLPGDEIITVGKDLYDGKVIS